MIVSLYSGVNMFSILGIDEAIVFVDDDLKVYETIDTSWGFEPKEVIDKYEELVKKELNKLPQYIDLAINSFESSKYYKELLEEQKKYEEESI